MRWLRRNAWWALVVIALMLVGFGVTDLISGAAADPGIATGLTGMSLDDLEAEGSNAFRLYDFMTRANGWA